MGTVKLVDGDRIYLETAQGDTVIVNTDAETKIQITKEGTAADLKTGTPVVVQGERAEDGSVTATTVSQGGGFLGRQGTPGRQGPR